MAQKISHYGSAIGEAIGAEMQDALNELIADLADKQGYHFLSTSPIEGKKRFLLIKIHNRSFCLSGNIFDIKNIIAIKPVGFVARIQPLGGDMPAYVVPLPFLQEAGVRHLWR